MKLRVMDRDIISEDDLLGSVRIGVGANVRMRWFLQPVA